MLQIKNVNLNVSGVVLLQNISIELELGKIYGILGPNGCLLYTSPSPRDA